MLVHSWYLRSSGSLRRVRSWSIYLTFPLPPSSRDSVLTSQKGRWQQVAREEQGWAPRTGDQNGQWAYLIWSTSSHLTITNDCDTEVYTYRQPKLDPWWMLQNLLIPKGCEYFTIWFKTWRPSFFPWYPCTSRYELMTVKRYETECWHWINDRLSRYNMLPARCIQAGWNDLGPWAGEKEDITSVYQTGGGHVYVCTIQYLYFYLYDQVMHCRV